MIYSLFKICFENIFFSINKFHFYFLPSFFFFVRNHGLSLSISLVLCGLVEEIIAYFDVKKMFYFFF